MYTSRMRAPARRSALGPSTTAWAVWTLAALLYCVAIFHRMALGVASLSAADRLGISPSAVTLAAVAQLVAYLVMQLPAGLMADRIGPRRSLAAGLATIAAGELVFAVASDLPTAIAARVLVGAGDACIFLNVLRLAATWLPRRYPLLAAAAAFAGAAGQLAGTTPLRAALERFGWTATFTASAIATLVLALVAALAIRDRPRGAPGPVDGREPVLTALRGSWNRRATRLGFYVHFVLMGPFVVLAGMWGLPYLVSARGVAAPTAGAILAGAVAAFALSTPVGALLGRRSAHAVHRAALGLGTAVAAALACAVAWPAGDLPIALTVATFMLVGAAGAVSMTAFGVARRESSDEHAGTASGLVNLGGFSAAIAGDAAIALALLAPVAGADGYRLGLAVVVALLLWGLLGVRRHGAALAGDDHAGATSRLQRRRRGDLDAGQRLRHGAFGRGLLHRALELRRVDARHLSAHVDPHRLDGDLLVARAEGARGQHVELIRRMSGARQPLRQGHAEAGGLSRGDQLLGRRAPAMRAGARRPRHGEQGSLAADEAHMAASTDEAPAPHGGRG
ncbi:MAG: hypothetical protein QOG70_456 [Solirubrobacteraceae bacterium]|nr:hypothetical protein [Solirubrobacteraceae bacterium]